MADRGIIPILVTMMLVTGVCNTILNKFQVIHTYPTDSPVGSKANKDPDQRTCNVYGIATLPILKSISSLSSR